MKRLILLLVLISATCSGKTDEEAEEKVHQIKQGNLLLNGSQQPSPLFSFGQNIVDKKDLLLYFNDILAKRINEHYNTINPYILYGIRNNLSVIISVPFAERYQVRNSVSSGIGDILTQFEWAFLNKDTQTSSLQSTLVGAINIPTGSLAETEASIRFPSTGLGSTSFIFGATTCLIDIKWYAFGSLFGLVTTKPERNTKYGNYFFYQAGVGRNIANIAGSALNWLVEFNGYIIKSDLIDGQIDPNSSRSSFFIGPSLQLSTERTMIQIGISVPVYQKLSGVQNKNRFDFEIQFSWKISAPNDED